MEKIIVVGRASRVDDRFFDVRINSVLKGHFVKKIRVKNPGRTYINNYVYIFVIIDIIFTSASEASGELIRMTCLKTCGWID